MIDQVKEIFAAAIELGPDERTAYVARACRGDEKLSSEVGSWLASYADAADFLESPAFKTHSDAFESNVEGRQFGKYKVVREIGRGGMGTVYLAERSDGEFDQIVAIKIVRQTIVERDVITRFSRERQILASLNHPNIARLHDGGVSDAGEPFLVMEYIDGLPLIHHVEAHDLDLNGRLETFLKVCRAVAYAHRNLVVHRDIKPSNILVDSLGEPKLLDFGLAKALDEALAADDQTKTAFIALTPAYASPEQLRGQSVNTTTDVYSLGVVLYELLTGTRPYKVESNSFDDAYRAITTAEPLVPSQAVNTREHLAVDTSSLKGDLDNIILTAISKEPARRYQSVEDLAADIQAYLDGRPVTARAQTLTYRLTKFVRRNAVAVGASALILISLVAGLAAALTESSRAKRERAKAETVNTFLSQMLNYSDPASAIQKGANGSITIKDVLDKAARQIDDPQYASEPDVAAKLHAIIGESYLAQGLNQSAEDHLRTAVRLQTSIDGGTSITALDMKETLVEALSSLSRGDEVEQLGNEILPSLRKAVAAGDIPANRLVDLLIDLADIARAKGDSHEAEALFREAVTSGVNAGDSARREASLARSALALTFADQGRLDEAIATMRDELASLRKTSTSETPDLGYALTTIGRFLSENNEFQEADVDLGEGEKIYRHLLGGTHLFLADNLRIQANSFYLQGRTTEAQKAIDEALRIYRNSTSEDYVNYPSALMISGLLYNKAGDAKKAEDLLREALRLRRKNLPSDHYLTAVTEGALGECLMSQKRFAEAEDLLTASYEKLRASQGESNPKTVLARERLDAFQRMRSVAQK